jgi:hypothetical protein
MNSRNQFKLPEIRISEEDIPNVVAIRCMINNSECPNCKTRLPDGWKALNQYWEEMWNELISDAMNGISTRTKRELSDIKIAIMRGFKYATLEPYRLIKILETQIESDIQATENLSKDIFGE